ncbi:UCRQ-1 [Scenedesmus sp. PABB004]|nr:UCRQ-1 [Scenedesmus sp. PABB004]
MAPRMPVPLREIVYSLSPYNQEVVMKGVQKLPTKIAKYFQRNWAGLAIFNVTLLGPIMYADAFVEREKLASRY